jgi:U4/U6.U5 tri-snRNP-associated protein 2
MVNQTLKRDGAEHLQVNTVRPTKKQRIFGDAPENDTEMPVDSEEEEEDMPMERAEESRASDLYLDTASLI